MPNRIIATADDFGLSRGVTDTILETSDSGSLSRVSILPNGYDVERALHEWKKRSPKLSLSIHLNLTEGKALSDPKDVPSLTDTQGFFRHSPISLFARVCLSSSRTRRTIIREVEHEFIAQIKRIRSHTSETGFSVDGHQHVHMIPPIFRLLTQMHSENRFTHIRLPYEPFFMPAGFLFFNFSIGGLVRHLGLNLLSGINRRVADRAGVPRTDFFVGTLLSGRLDLETVRNALGEIQRKGGGLVEIGLHPGEPLTGELDDWKGDTQWHRSLWREREKMLLKDKEFANLIMSFEKGGFTTGGSRFLEISRFAITGIISGGVSLAFLYLLTEIIGVWYLFSAFVSYAVAIGVSFTLQKFWTFSHTSLKRVREEVVLYVLNNIIGITVDMAGIFILVEYLGVWYMAAQLLLLALIAVWNFFAYRYFIFPRSV